MIGAPAGHVLVVSSPGSGPSHGGLFAYDGDRFTQVDALACTGMAISDTHFARAVVRDASTSSRGELAIYDHQGFERYLRVDGASGIRDLHWEDPLLVAVSAGTNSVVWIAPTGRIIRTWTAPGVGDAWHLTGLVRHGGKYFVAAYGRFEGSAAWRDGRNLGLGTGVLIDLDTGANVLAGLEQPHSPRMVDGFWMICSSGTNELITADPDSGASVNRIALGGRTRGIAVTDDHLFIGVSALPGRGGASAVCVLDRHTLGVLETIEVRTPDIYDVAFIPAPLALAAGQSFFDLVQRQAQVCEVGQPLPPGARQVRITAHVPTTLAAGVEEDYLCEIESLGPALLISAPPHPVHIASWWESLEPGLANERESSAVRTELPHAVAFGVRTQCTWSTRTPEKPGEYRLHLTLVQEGVSWFSDLDEKNEAVFDVVVEVSGSSAGQVVRSQPEFVEIPDALSEYVYQTVEQAASVPLEVYAAPEPEELGQKESVDNALGDIPSGGRAEVNLTGHTAGPRAFASLVRTLSTSEFKLRYAGSYLGYFWSLSKPLVLFAVLYYVFTEILRFGAGVPNYALHLLLGIVLWTFFLECTMTSTTILVARADMLRKVAFPRVALPVSVSITAALTLFLNLIAVLGVLLFAGIEPTMGWLIFPLVLVQLYVLALGMSLILSSLYVDYRDVGQVWELGAQVLFYASPIVYPLTFLSEVPDWLRSIALVNPIGQIVSQSRQLLISDAAGNYAVTAGSPTMYAPYVITGAALVCGLLIYHRTSSRMIERL